MNVQKLVSVEEMCRELLEIAIRDGLVENPKGETLESISNGDLVGMSNYLNKIITQNDNFSVDSVLITDVKHTVNLGATPRLPFNTAEVVKHEGDGVVEIEFRQDGNLYIDGKKIVLHLSERQKGNKRTVGHELRQELESGEQVLLNSNVLDYLYDHPELFPEHWKKDENGDTHYIFFWGSIFRDPANGSLFARCLSWSGGGLDRDYSWLDSVWRRQFPSASLAS